MCCPTLRYAPSTRCIILIDSCHHELEACRIFRHGGPRRRGDECSDSLSVHQCRLVLGAASRARELGKPFNRFITILWERGGLSPQSATAATGRFIKLASDWLRLRGHPLCWTYVHEGGGKNGIHVHILLHVPPNLDSEFRPMPRQWVKRLLSGHYVRKSVLSKKIVGANTPDGALDELYRALLRVRLHYMLKAADPALLDLLDMQGWGRVQWGRQGRVFGKRAGRWQERRV